VRLGSLPDHHNGEAPVKQENNRASGRAPAFLLIASVVDAALVAIFVIAAEATQ
jgi:hypothetical protein